MGKKVLTWSLQLVGLHFGRPRSLCQLLSQLRSQPLLRCQALCLCQHHLHLRFVPWMLNMCFQMKDEVSVFGQVVRGLVISASEYCDYIADGYFGYFWPSKDGSFECAPSARRSSNDQNTFCVWSDGDALKIPPGASADCSRLSSGRIGLVLPVTELQFQV